MKKSLVRIITVCLLCCMLVGMASTASAAWRQSGGRWWYDKRDGSYYKNEWLQDGGKWFYFDKDGWMTTGWKKIKNKWYYFDEQSGAMKTGWLNYAGKWYYFNNKGQMMRKWVNDGGKWYFMTSSGAMKTGWLKYEKKWYYLDDNGVMKTKSWLQSNGKWYYFGKKGIMATGWEQIGADYYYFYNSGVMAHDTVVDGYILGSTGKRLNTVLVADKASITASVGNTVEVVFTFSRTGYLTYHFSGTAGLNCRWGSWYNNGKNIKLYVTGLSRGTSTIIVTNSYNSDTVRIPVTIR